MKRLDLVIGPNGAGKSTFVERTLSPRLPGSVFVNADLIAKRRWPDDPLNHSYDAAQIAAKTRDALIAQGRSFIAETVFSHPSKLDLIESAHAAGYVVMLHVVLIPEDLAVARVRHRVAAGGHDVPEDKVRGRYRRLWGLAAVAIDNTDSARIYDNSRLRGPKLIAQMSAGLSVGASAWPDWAPEVLRVRWP